MKDKKLKDLIKQLVEAIEETHEIDIDLLPKEDIQKLIKQNRRTGELLNYLYENH